MSLRRALVAAALALIPPRAAAGGPAALPRAPLFEPLLADPRWPRFAGTMVRYVEGEGLDRVWLADFGGGMGLVEGDAPRGGRWQAGFQAGVFTQWDMETLSNDQISADFLVGAPLTGRWGRWSAAARVYHVSTHLGDEFVLTHPQVARVNLSYEAIDLKVSRDAGPARLYAGAGRMYRRDPEGTPPGSLQAGVEYLHPTARWRGRLRPTAALDVQSHEKSGWTPGYSARLGVRLDNEEASSRRLLLFVEYYRGRDPNGQFFRRMIEYGGLGLHAYF